MRTLERDVLDVVLSILLFITIALLVFSISTCHDKEKELDERQSVEMVQHLQSTGKYAECIDGQIMVKE